MPQNSVNQMLPLGSSTRLAGALWALGSTNRRWHPGVGTVAQIGARTPVAGFHAQSGVASASEKPLIALPRVSDPFAYQTVPRALSISTPMTSALSIGRL